MLDSLKRMLGLTEAADFADLVKKGALIIDVRSESEFAAGHIKGAKNMPLPGLLAHVAKLDKNQPIITCCASGVRSASARNTLLANGFAEVYNGGGWKQLQAKLS